MKVFLTNEDKTELEEIMVTKEYLSGLENTVTELQKLAVVEHPFNVDFESVENLLTSDNSYFLSFDSHGDNWRVSKDTDPRVLEPNDNNVTKARVFVDTQYGDYFRAMLSNRDYVFDFTAPTSGTYSMSVKFVTTSTSGYAAVYLNDKYLSTIDTYSENGGVFIRYFHDLQLNAGKYANKIKIVPTGKSQGTGAYVTIVKFSFADEDHILDFSQT